ncbi:MmgE/PrpD family protein [Haladaptatus paucihalophilus DX253]|uniref:MmgE/PrpD family protein n=2 Tax=Haladaptatus paucihalophilus DX253 TaxID=797209 RepID=E7QZK6_HALPU|nr:MmgE/PrpD family protein [Haladaptatus paucihalophilus]EFW90127.1 MmgE/PrpD family protein [Haladaptatus paucihalophilus DX253]
MSVDTMDTTDAVAFVHSATLRELPSSVERAVRVRVLDTLAAMTAGYRQDGIDIVRRYALDRFGGESTATLFDGSGTRVHPEGATLANSTAANALDIDDGHREVKGHPAAVVVPAALATAESEDSTVETLLDAVYVGYEIGVRAGLAIHHLDGVYTGTGSWGAVGAAAAVARLRDFPTERTAHALGIAEYHAPRTPIMRGVERPGMTKDGIGWGSYVGAVSAQLAASGFTGSGTVFDEVDTGVVAPFGDVHHVTEAYLKPYPCCRWVQPGVEAALSLAESTAIDPTSVETVRVHTFEEATHLRTRSPDSPEEAQYSYPFPVATALVRGRFTQAEHASDVLSDPDILALSDAVELRVDEALDGRFPGDCLARLELDTESETYASDVTRPPGAREQPLADDVRREKARRLVTPTLPPSAIEKTERRLRDSASVATLLSPWRT